MFSLRSSIIAIILVLPILISATAYHVGTGYEYSEIQDAIDECVTGDSVIVHENATNTYTENLEIIYYAITILCGSEDEITLYSTNGINIWMTNINTTSEMLIEGFTIENTSSYSMIHHTGYSWLKVRNCILTATGGRAIEVAAASNVLIENNELETAAAARPIVTLTDVWGSETIVSGNIFTNADQIALVCTDTDGLEIEENVFQNCDQCISCITDDVSYSVTIRGNLVYDLDCAAEDDIIKLDATDTNLDPVIIENNTFFNDSVTEPTLLWGIDGGYTASDYEHFRNNIFRNFSDINVSGTSNLSIDYCCYDAGISIPAGMEGSGNTNTDPDFADEDNGNFYLLWGSPCIDTGDPSSDDDADYSPADIGCFPYERDEFDHDAYNYTWQCFPKLDVDDDVNNGDEDDYLYPDEIWEDYWDQKPDTISVWYQRSLMQSPNIKGILIGGSYTWNPGQTFEIFSYLGLKVYASGSHFIGGYLMYENYNFDEFPANQENWIGYFLEKSQQPVDAISSSVMEKILEIKTQRWSVNRETTEDPLYIASKYTFNYGDCVVLVLDEAVDGFEWQQGRDDIEPYIRPIAEHFEYEDELDYQPIYVEFGEDLPEEIAIYVNDVCKGASVVDDTLCQICSYILGEEAGQEIEFVTFTGGRNFRNQKYLVLDNISGEVKSEKLLTGTPGDFYRISFKEDDQLPPVVKYNVYCVPNPFNPTTDIYFNLDESADVKLSIYNIRGQLVEVIADEYFRKGEYSINWNGTDKAGKPVGSGVYFYRLICDEDIIDGKMLMLK